MKFPDQYRIKNHTVYAYATKDGEPFGAFRIQGDEAKGRILNIIACNGAETGWEHVSVSLLDFPNNTPSWEEMCLVKDLFWDNTETVVQYHVAAKDHVNMGEVLHLWRWTQPFPMPPKECV